MFLTFESYSYFLSKDTGKMKVGWWVFFFLKKKEIKILKKIKNNKFTQGFKINQGQI